MKMTPRTQRILRLQQAIFYLLLITVIVLLAKVTIEHNRQYDWTANNRHTLSETSQKLLAEINTAVDIQVFAAPDYEYYDAVVDLVDRYQRHSDKIHVNYIDPSRSPDLVRQYDIQQQGEMVVRHGEMTQHVQDLSEQSLTNALISVSRQQQQWLVFIDGHGERSLFENNNFSLSTWAQQLQGQGFKLHSQNLVENPDLPDNTSALVIASPIKDWLPGEVAIVRKFIDHGGNLLWLADPEQTASLLPLAEKLGIEFIPGSVFDPNAARLGLEDPRFVLISDYANHPVGVATASVSLLADASAIQRTDPEADSDWTYLNLLNSQPNTWVESSSVNQNNVMQQAFDAGEDVKGPVSLGTVISRPRPGNSEQQQRIAVVGDSDFASNAYIGNAANLNLSMALANWLAADDKLISIPVKTSIGTQLSLTKTQSIIIGFGFLLVIPLILLSSGLWIWWRRRRR